MSSKAPTVIVQRVFSPSEDVRALIGELETELSEEYPPEQRHGLALEAIFEPHIRFFLARLDGVSVGCGGVALFADYAELKRMFVRASARGRDVAEALLTRIEKEAFDAGSRVLRLETGDRQLAALRFYERVGFRRCEAFGDYVAMSSRAIATSVFMEKRLITAA